jgi:hypothetical protein
MNTTQAPSALSQLFFDLFVTALEGGIGYWSECSEYKPFVGDSDVENVKDFVAVIINTVEDDERYEGGEHRIDRNVVARGYGLATSKWRDQLNWSSSKPPVVVGPETDWDFDASDADMIVQLGLFGDVVYG